MIRAMAARLKRAGHSSRYRRRKQVVEPVFEHARGGRQFLLRGLDQVQGERAELYRPQLLKLEKAGHYAQYQ